MTTHIDETGMFVIRGRLAPEAGEVLVKALDAASEKLYGKEQSGGANAGDAEATTSDVSAEAPPDAVAAGSSVRQGTPTCPAEAPAETGAAGSEGRPNAKRAWIGASNVPVSAETARRIACDAGKVRMTHRNGEILSVGREVLGRFRARGKAPL